MSDSITFKYTLTEGDFVQSIRAHAFKRKPWWALWVLLAALVFVDVSWVMYVIDRPRLEAGEIIGMIMATVGPAILVWWVWWGHPKRVARGAPYLGVDIAGTVSLHGIASHSALGKVEATWASYSTVFESADHFLLYLGRNVFNPFPKRCFSNPKDVDRFRQLIRENVPKTKLLDRPEK